MPTLLQTDLNGVLVYQSSLFDPCAVQHGFTTRLGGISSDALSSMNLGFSRGDSAENVHENYRRLSDALQIPYSRITSAQQVHGTTIVQVTDSDAGHGVRRPSKWKADGLMTNVPNLPLVGYGADCNVLLFFDPVHRAIATAHAGWRGTAQDMAAHTLRAMHTAYGTQAHDVFVALAPSIGACCFETDEDVPEALSKQFPEKASFYIVSSGAKYHVDLQGYNKALLLRSGVNEQNIHLSRLCTACDKSHFYSHRRDGENRGVQAGVICLIP